jgi:excisionase family DNA binding protein
MQTGTRPQPQPLTDWADVPLALNVAQVVEITGLARETVYGLIRSGELPSKKIGRRRLITKTAVRALVESP